jgi:phenylacetate-CoA ligase
MFEDLLHPYVGRYMESPEWVKASAGRAYAWLPPRLRYGAAYDRFREEARARPDAAGMERLVRGKLDEALRWAIQTVPAYAGFKELLRAPRDPFRVLAALPFTDKLDIKRHPERYLSAQMPESARLEMFTGGSTRNPMRFFLAKHVTRAKEYAFMQEFRERVGLEEGDMRLALRGRTVPTAAEGGRIWMMEPIKRQLILSTDHLECRYMPQYVEALSQHRPQWIEAFPSALYPLARWLARNPLPEFTRQVRGVMLFSENVYGYQMRKIREVFGCPILAHYGHSERVLMAASMPEDERYFFFPQYGHLELVDNDGAPVTTPGVVGHVVGTSFDNRVMPFVRYRTGDLAVLSDRPHPELPGYPVCERIEGRLHEFIVCRDDRLVSITTLGVAHFPQLARVDAIQYEQREAGHVVLKVVSETPLTPDECDAIGRAVAAKTQGGCDVRVERVDSIPRTPSGKHLMLEQHIDLGKFWGNTLGDRPPVATSETAVSLSATGGLSPKVLSGLSPKGDA